MVRPRSRSRSLGGRSPDCVVVLRSVPRPIEETSQITFAKKLSSINVIKSVYYRTRYIKNIIPFRPPRASVCSNISEGITTKLVPFVSYSSQRLDIAGMFMTHLCLRPCIWSASAAKRGGSCPGVSVLLRVSPPQTPPSPGSSRPASRHGPSAHGPGWRWSGTSGWCR